MSRSSVLAIALAICPMVVGACASVPEPAACAMSAGDRAWIDRAVAAWRFTSREITGISRVPKSKVFLFSADCLLTSEDALSSPVPEGVTWAAASHGGNIALPNGSQIPVGVTSFASGAEDLTFFVMAAPSVWTSAGLGSGADLERTLTAVLLHEALHVAQIGPYGKRLGALIERYSLPDEFNDSAVQERFGDNQEFAASVRRESELFLAAAAAEDDAEALRLAREARELMRARQARWQVGEDAYLVEAEDIWLTFEGSGQWTAYQWVIHPEGGALPAAEALPRFAKGREWSQTHGFALVMALDRVAGPGWKHHAFGDGAKTVIEMLDYALATK